MGSLSGSQKEIQRQGECLVEWATKRGFILPDTFIEGLEKYEATTTEHEVYWRRFDNRAIKCTYPGQYGFANGPKGKKRAATPLFYLQRLDLMKEVFGSDIRLEGVGIRDRRPYVITSQEIVQGPHPAEEEISDFMKSMNFTSSRDSPLHWRRQEPEDSKFASIVVSDTKIENFIKSPAGVVPIDVIIGFSDSEF